MGPYILKTRQFNVRFVCVGRTPDEISRASEGGCLLCAVLLYRRYGGKLVQRHFIYACA